MNIPWKMILWQQFGAAIDDLDNALRACPDELWRARFVTFLGADRLDAKAIREPLLRRRVSSLPK
jgi:hypothetical protein